MPFARVPDEKMYYAAHGSEKCPVVLIHGAGGSHLAWPPQVRRLEGPRLSRWTFRGMGNRREREKAASQPTPSASAISCGRWTWTTRFWWGTPWAAPLPR